MIKLTIPRVPPSPNELLGFHWRYRKKNCDLWQREVFYALLQEGHRNPVPYGRAKVTIDRHSHGELDPDNLVGCVKPIIDALRYAYVLVDDSPAHLVLTVTQQRCPRRVGPKTLIEIQPLEAS